MPKAVFTKYLSVLLFVATACACQAAPTYLGLFMNGHKIGYSSYDTTQVSFNGQPAARSDSRTVMNTGLEGTAMRIQIDSQTWANGNDDPLQMNFLLSSNGRTQEVKASFDPANVTFQINNSGVVSHRVVIRPSGQVVDDPISLVLKGKTSCKCLVLDPSTVSFVENTVKVIGKRSERYHGKLIEETVVDIQDPRATTRAYLDPKGELIRAEGPMGISMVPQTQKEALSKADGYSSSVDLAFSNSIVPTGNLPDPSHTKELKLKIVGHDLGSLPSDETQTVAKDGSGWIVDVHPPRLEQGQTIAQAAAQKPSWVAPDLDMPSDSEQFKTLAHQIVGDKTHVVDAAMAIKKWVFDQMEPNAGIGVLRDATEVLKSKEGVCRDYAILCGTLLRAAGIPTRLASGLVNWDGTFYYHAWDEVWDGTHWIGIDSTTADRQISAAHIKLSDGSTAKAFTFAVLGKVSIKVMAASQG